MRPNLLTISIVPALIGALIGVLIVNFQQSDSTSISEQLSPTISSLPTQTEDIQAPTVDKLEPETNAPVAAVRGIDNSGDETLVAVVQVIAWPLTVLLLFTLVAYNARLGRIFGLGTRLVKKISAGGVQIEINSETVQLVQRQLHGTFADLITSSADEYERISDIQEIPTHLKNAILENDLKSVDGLRATVHVNDVIFPEYLYQLVNYYPKGGGANRRNSQRYGIIGRSWRSRTSHGTGDAFAGIGSVEALVENWGMTEEEAQGQVSGRPSSLSIIVSHENIPVGILFVDSTKKDAFGDDNEATEFANRIAESDSVHRLGKALAMTLAPLRTAAPSLRIIG